MQVTLNDLSSVLPSLAFTDIVTIYDFPAVTENPCGSIAESLLVCPTSIGPRFKVTEEPESPYTVTVHELIGLFPVFLMVAETRMCDDALTTSTLTT